MPVRHRVVILLGAFVSLRAAEVFGLRVDFMRGIVHPAVQYPAEALKTETSRTPVPNPASLALELSAHVKAGHSGETLLTDDDGAQVGPWKLEWAMRKARGKVQDLPTGFRFHDLLRRVDAGRDRCGDRRSDGTEAEPDRDRAMNVQLIAR
ncbi:hypothetical protein GCM10023194_18520 [Planotetraspora phitsanulokensis]|uniref:Uncharacterized protein n=1 Tax=Planotetraspora phitsanulokensis TaxID=575192 RepID=A0A8J3TY50_9ACTN|nr:hypothetical protein [Planotetraspora phitsanulokensis]GII35213.1 hypothetical protein Pph01_02160 [Planotetraspora phitsanulokensis]